MQEIASLITANFLSMKNYFKILQTFFVSLLVYAQVNAAITINEFQASNTKTLYYNGKFPDWIELKNSSASAVNISGYYLSDDRANFAKWAFPTGTTIPANGYLLVYANAANTGLQTNFKLSSTGDQLYLSTNTLVSLDSVVFGEQYPDISFGRKLDGSWSYFNSCTANAANNDASAFYSFAMEPSFSVESGIYSSPFSLVLTAEPGASIYYTTDGSAPTKASTLYTAPISISSTAVVKAIASTSAGVSLVSGCSYVFGASHKLPVIMLTSANDRAQWVSKKIGKEDVAGRVAVEYFDKNGTKTINQYAYFNPSGFSSVSKAQLNGKISPAYDKQSFKYKIFDNKNMLENIGFLIRNSSQDYLLSHMRDAVWSRTIGDDEICDGMQFEAYSAAVLYVDGVYDGVVHIFEDDDKEFIENNFPGKGAYESTTSFYYNGLGTDKYNYNLLADRIAQQNAVNIHDVLSVYYFINFAQLQGDMPKSVTVAVPGQQPLTKTYLHDMDWCLGFRGHSRAMAYSTIGSWTTTSMYTFGFPSNILNYTPYKEEGAQFSCAMFNFVLDTTRILNIIEEIRASYKGEMDATAAAGFNTVANSSNYNVAPLYYNEAEWNKHVDTLKMFVKISSEGSMDWIKTKFGYTNQIEMTFQTSGATHGNIRVHGIKVLGDNRKGKFFSGIPLNLEAIPQPGYAFSHWEIDASGTNSKYSNTYISDATVKAVFIPIAYTAHNVHINEIQSVNNTTITDEFGGYADWIEIYNKESYPVDLAGYYVSDDTCDLRKWKIKSSQPLKTTVQPGDWLLLWADGDTLQGANHLDFKFDNSEMFVLTYPNGITIADKIVFNITADQSYGSETDGATKDVYFTVPTPGASNGVTTNTKEYANTFNVYPNPASNEIFVASSGTSAQLEITVFTVDGRLVKHFQNVTTNSALDMKGIETGIYIITINDGKAISTQRIVKM